MKATGSASRSSRRLTVYTTRAASGQEEIGNIPWSPLARGRLTRDWNEATSRSETDQFGKTLSRASEEGDRKVVERVAAERGVRAQVALVWVLAKPGPRRSSARRRRRISTTRSPPY